MQKTTSPITLIRKIADGALTASANSNKVNAGGYSNAKAFLRISAASGSSPTLDVKFQDSYDGTNWVDVASGAFAQTKADRAFRSGLKSRVMQATFELLTFPSLRLVVTSTSKPSIRPLIGLRAASI